MSIWKRLRLKTDIMTNEIANMLHISEEKYIEIEKGIRPMPTRLINDFMKIYNDRKVMKGDIRFKMYEVNEFLKNLDLNQLKKEFNYSTNAELAKAIGIGTCQIYRIKSHLDNLSKNTKIKIYNFCNDPLNIRINNDKKENNPKTYSIEESKELINRILKEQKISIKQLSNKLNVHHSTISNWKIGAYKMNSNHFAALQDMFNKPDSCELSRDDKETDIEFSDISEEKTLNTLSVNSGLINKLKLENEQLKRTINCYEKLIERL